MTLLSSSLYIFTFVWCITLIQLQLKKHVKTQIGKVPMYVFFALTGSSSEIFKYGYLPPVQFDSTYLPISLPSTVLSPKSPETQIHLECTVPH